MDRGKQIIALTNDIVIAKQRIQKRVKMGQFEFKKREKYLDATVTNNSHRRPETK